MKRAYVLLASLVVSVLLYFLAAGFNHQAIANAANDGEACETEVAQPDEDILTLDGKRYKIVAGVVYLCKKSKWVFSYSMITRFGNIYDIRKSGDDCEVTVTQTGKKYPLPRHFSSGFEVPNFRALFNTGWNVTSLLSPKANTPRKYSDLHSSLMKGGKFLDNRMDLDKKNVYAGKKSLRFHAVNPDQSTQRVSKSLIEKKDLCFGKGDHIWYSAWYYLEKGMPTTLVDFETGRFKGGPGMRLIIRRNKYATMELKFADKPQYNQFKVPLPIQKWFNVKVHLLLSNNDDGVIEMWQDGKKILSTKGKTLPTHDTIYNMLQVGITAARHETTLLVDDVIVSNKPL